jgi:hypothetical protein
MGCALRAVRLGLLWCFAGTFLGAAGFLYFFTNLERVRANQAMETPEKSLRQALNEDGPAWVRVTIEPASGAVPLKCGMQDCVWKRVEGSYLKEQRIKKGGEWTTREVFQPLRQRAENIPVVLRGDGTTLAIDNWLGVQVGAELLHVRSDESQRHSLAEIGSGVLEVKDYREHFLPVGTEMWILGKFEQGRPQVFLDDSFHLTGFGKERFTEGILGKSRLYVALMKILALLGVVFLAVFFRTLLKKSPAAITVSVESSSA